MKAKAQPCLRDYLTIHVPASALMGDRSKKKSRTRQQININPLMNKKLQLFHKDIGKKVQVIYSSLPNRSFGKKRKLQSIPLLSNINLNCDHKLRIVKDSKKSSYDFVFEKDKLMMKPKSNQKNIISNNKIIFHSKSAKRLEKQRPMSEIFNRGSSVYSSQKFLQSVSRFEFKTQQYTSRKIQSSPTMEVSGSKARLSKTASYWRKDYRQHRFGEDQDQNQLNIKIFH